MNELKTLPVTAEGFLCNSADWSEPVAQQVAELENLTLTPAHWELIIFIRHYYQTFKHLPNLRVFIKAVAQTLGEEKGNSRYIHKLFPNTPLKSVCKIAGLPKPPACL